MSETVLHQTLGPIVIVERGETTSKALVDGSERVVSNFMLVEPKPAAPVAVVEESPAVHEFPNAIPPQTAAEVLADAPNTPIKTIEATPVAQAPTPEPVTSPTRGEEAATPRPASPRARTTPQKPHQAKDKAASRPEPLVSQS